MNTMPPKNEIWYTTSDGCIVTPYENAKFGANIISNTYENGKGVITFDAPVVFMEHLNFRSCSNLVSVILPDGLTVIGISAFIGCKSLTNIIIPDSVAIIGTLAF